MNIFVVDEDPIKAAQMLCDRHVNKMILESAQILCFVANRYEHPAPYSTHGAHKNHPCTLWAGNTKENWFWLVQHGLALNDEKIFRTGKSHTSAEVIKWLLQRDFSPPPNCLTPFAQAMPVQYRNVNAVLAYRTYYLKEKQFFKDGKRPVWTKRNPPDWWKFR